jgi:hypothetical protein
VLAGLKRRSSSFNHPRLEHILDKGEAVDRSTLSPRPCTSAVFTLIHAGSGEKLSQLQTTGYVAMQQQHDMAVCMLGQATATAGATLTG